VSSSSIFCRLSTSGFRSLLKFSIFSTHDTTAPSYYSRLPLPSLRYPLERATVVRGQRAGARDRCGADCRGTWKLELGAGSSASQIRGERAANRGFGTGGKWWRAGSRRNENVWARARGRSVKPDAIPSAGGGRFSGGGDEFCCTLFGRGSGCFERPARGRRRHLASRSPGGSVRKT
jgi:hypothetical protein